MGLEVWCAKMVFCSDGYIWREMEWNRGRAANDMLDHRTA